MSVNELAKHPIHLGLGAKAIVQPEFTGELSWYEGYGERHGGDGKEGRLVAIHDFDASWTSWEMHPLGDEVVLCIRGRITLIQAEGEPGGPSRSIVLEAGEYAINPPGVWHTADVDSPVTALFITAGEGTTHAPR